MQFCLNDVQNDNIPEFFAEKPLLNSHIIQQDVLFGVDHPLMTSKQEYEDEITPKSLLTTDELHQNSG